MHEAEHNGKNPHAEGLWWKRFLYTVTGANNDYELGPNWFASVMGTGIIANAGASLPLLAEHLQTFAFIIWLNAYLLSSSNWWTRPRTGASRPLAYPRNICWPFGPAMSSRARSGRWW